MSGDIVKSENVFAGPLWVSIREAKYREIPHLGLLSVSHGPQQIRATQQRLWGTVETCVMTHTAPAGPLTGTHPFLQSCSCLWVREIVCVWCVCGCVRLCVVCLCVREIVCGVSVVA